MTKEEVIRMAREAGAYHYQSDANIEQIYEFPPEPLMRFAALVAAAEREACAKLVEAYEPRCDSCPGGVVNAIRNRK